MRSIIAIFKLLAFALICVLITPLQLAMLSLTNKDGAYIFPMLFHRIVSKCLGIKVIITGAPIHKKQTFFISNHLSYLDIVAIGGHIKASFVAKKDVASWPLFGFLSRLQQTAFISRDRADAKKEKNALDNLLSEGKSLIIFPEGTSTDGRDVAPFKSSLFSIVYKEEAQDIWVQPFSIVMRDVDKCAPETQELKDIYAWHNKMDLPLAPHLWRFAKSKGATITINFHPAFKASDYNDRKTLAQHCHDVVSHDIKTSQQSD